MAYATDRADNGTRVGLDFANTCDLKSGKFAPLGYLYRRTPKDKGIVLNLCPWCGADFRKLWPREWMLKRAGSAAPTREDGR
jgi:hypothetical protein